VAILPVAAHVPAAAAYTGDGLHIPDAPMRKRTRIRAKLDRKALSRAVAPHLEGLTCGRCFSVMPVTCMSNSHAEVATGGVHDPANHFSIPRS
jgi:hypothetical protein